MKHHVFAVIALLLPQAAFADVLAVEPVTDDVWALVGPKVQRDPENLGNNATFGVVVTRDGVVLIDPGGSWKGAEMIGREGMDQLVQHTEEALQGPAMAPLLSQLGLWQSETIDVRPCETRLETSAMQPMC